MKKILILVCTLFITVNVIVAQEAIKFGVMGAFNYSTTTTPDQFEGTNVEDLNWKAGYKAGLIADIPLGAALSIQPSLLFSSKGYEIMYGTSNIFAKVSATANYLELPLMVAFKIPFSDNFKLAINAGPYFAYGVGGKTSLSGVAGSLSGNVDWDTFKGDGEDEFYAMDKFDWGLGVGVALEISRLKFSINYDHGLQSIYDVKDDNNKLYNYGVWAGLGVYF